MAYTVLARKYRPQTFADLVGQEHVTRTLSNAIRSERVAHAFLFTGVRGVGKTTTARIVAKALNCERGPTPEPCGVCDPCRDITSGRDTDVLEMDGASNNSVEDVRRLQESIPYRPSRDRFKIVIVDEVHMLSTGAFNAFLKTLEEPPPHVKFIFATTEVHKVPVTIRSRCQRYDFRMIAQSVVSQRVREILAAESLDADDAAVAIVAREAAGSMRDALTLLDQIVAFGGDRLAGEEVARVLGIADRDVLHRVAKAVLDGDGADALRAVDELASRGLDMLHFARQLLDLVRDMVVLRVCGADTDLCTLVEEERARARAVGERTDLQELQRAFSALSKVVEDVGQSGTPRTTLEMGLVRLATRPPLRPLAELIARLDELERRAGGGAGGGGGRRGPRGDGGGRSTSAGGARARAAGTSAATGASAGTSAGAGAGASTGATATSASASAATSAGASVQAATTLSANSASAHADACDDPGTPVGDPAASVATRVGGSDRVVPPIAGSESGSRAVATRAGAPESAAHAVATRGDGPASVSREAAARAGAPERASNAASDQAGTPAAVGGVADEEAGRAAWERIASLVLETKPALGAVLQHGAPVEVSRERIVLAFEPSSFFGRQVESRDGQQAIADVAARVLGARPRVEVVYSSEAHGAAKTLAQEATERRDARVKATRESALGHPLVAEVSQLFDVPRERMIVRILEQGER